MTVTTKFIDELSSMESIDYEVDLDLSIESSLKELEHGIELYEMMSASIESEVSFESNDNILMLAKSLGIDISFEADEDTKPEVSKVDTAKAKAKELGSKASKAIKDGADKAKKYVDDNKDKWKESAKKGLANVKKWIEEKWRTLMNFMGERRKKILTAFDRANKSSDDIEKAIK